MLRLFVREQELVVELFCVVMDNPFLGGEDSWSCKHMIEGFSVASVNE